MLKKNSTNRIEKNYNKIIKAAFRSIANKGIEKTRINDISRLAGISPGTIYYYYKNKKELLISFLDWIMKSYFNGLNKRLQGNKNPLEKIHCLFQYQKHLITHEEELEKVMYEFWMMGIKTPYIKIKIKNLLESLKDNVQNIMKEGIEKQIFKKEASDIFPMIFISLIEGATFQYLINKDKFTIDKYFDYIETSVIDLIKIE
ncbi:MAG: TetR/AcrR family transcriptional regulator [bacterium]